MKLRSLNDLLDRALPLNRKERYFTGTVLPALIGGELEHLHRFAALTGAPDIAVRTARDDCSVLLFTEYGIAESATQTPRFHGLPTAKDTPDMVILVTEPAPVLIAVEAKMFDRPSRAERIEQLHRQAEILVPLAARLAEWLTVPVVRLVHIALLPEKLRASLEATDPLSVPIVTWEQIRDTWADSGGYYHHILDVALERYDRLVSRSASNHDANVLGKDLLHEAQTGTLTYSWMGRHGGFQGQALTADIQTGAWRTTNYQVRKAELPSNPNWFPVASFIAAVSDHRTD